MGTYTNSRTNEELKKILSITELDLTKGYGLKGHTYIDASRTQPAGEIYYILEVLTAGEVTYYNVADRKTTTDESLEAGDKIFGVFTSVEAGTDATAVLRCYKI